MTITELSIKRPTLVVVIFSALVLLGIYSYTQLNYELLPKITPPVITIATVYPGASPNEVETSVTKPVEDAISTLDQVDYVTASSSEGVSFVVIQFLQSADVDIQLQSAQRKVNQIINTLPSTVKSPVLSKFALDEIPVLRMGVTSNMAPKQFYQFVVDRIQPRISKISGVGQITLIGGNEREIKINLNADKIRSYGLSIPQVVQSIQSSNLDFPAGKIDNGSNQYVVRLAGKFNSLNTLKSIIVAHLTNGSNVRLEDIAEIEDGVKDPDSISRIDGVTSIGVLVQKQTDANSVDVSKLVKQELIKIENDYKADNVKFNIAQDEAQFTIDAANGVKFDLGLAVVLVAIVMLLFLHSFRNSFIVMLAIPCSLISTFTIMLIFGFTLNLMTLLGLSLVVGFLVDDSIVVLENIYHHIELKENKRDAALKGRNEIGFAALAITMVDVVIYIPLALTGGLIGNILREFAVVVVISTLLSLFVSFTVTPLLASRISKLERLTKATIIGRFALWFEKRFHNLTDKYISILRWALVNRIKVILGALILFFASFMLIGFGFIGAEFMTQTDRGEIAVTLEMPLGYTLEHTNYVTESVENYIRTLPELRKLFVNVGSSNEGLVGQYSNNTTELDVSLTPKDIRSKSTDDIGNEIKKFVQTIPGVKVRVNPIGIFGTANQSPIQLIVNGSDRNDVQKASEKLQNIVKTIPGTADVRSSSEDGNPETQIDIDRQKLSDFGLSIADVGSVLNIAFQGNDDSKYRDGDDDYSIKISLDQFDRSKISDIENLTFINKYGQSIQLMQFANVFQTTGPTKLQRVNRIPAVTVYSQVIGRPAGSVGADIKNAVAKAGMPKGVDIFYWGDLKNQADSFGSLGIALLAAIIFVYMVMVALYDSYFDPFVILFSIPLAMIGALLALALTMKSLNIFSILGVIMLIGLVGKNAILLVDRTNQRKREGDSTYDSLIEAGESRIRPIMMTTASMIFGMLPIATSLDAGSEWKSGLAWAIIGGLISSLFLTLVIVPVIYSLTEGLREKIPALFSRIFSRKEKEITEPGDDLGFQGK
jgi:HAE1 family hydrophobic/amphiphilic exporter-1